MPKTTEKKQTPSDTEIGMVMLLAARCRCGHEWLPREKGDRPRVCPKCKSPYWDRPKHQKAKNA